MADLLTRSQKAAAAFKNIETLGKEVKKVSTVKPASLAAIEISKITGLPTPVVGTSFLQVAMYVVAGILLIGLILLAVDQWITPIFQRSPGGSGYIPIPGTDLSQVYWTNSKVINNIIIGTPPPSPEGVTPPLYTTVIEGQTAYSLTLDVLINNEFPQNLGTDSAASSRQRIFFMLGPSLAKPTLTISLDNSKNTVYVTSYDSTRHIQTAIVDNVPIHKPFRIGVAKSQYALEAYLNGMLVTTINLRSNTINPTSGDRIFSPSNIIYTNSENSTVTLSSGIQAMNLRVFGYVVPPSEMKGRMDDLILLKNFNPPLPSSSSNSQCANTGY